MSDQPKDYPEWEYKREPWVPADYDDRVIGAVRALAAGQATNHQQTIAWEWLRYLTYAGAEYAELSYRPGRDGERDTSFAEGRRFVGVQMLKMLRPELTAGPDDTAKTPPKRITR